MLLVVESLVVEAVVVVVSVGYFGESSSFAELFEDKVQADWTFGSNYELVAPMLAQRVELALVEVVEAAAEEEELVEYNP